MGLKVCLSLRMNAFAVSTPPFDTTHTKKFYKDHPHLRCKDRDGMSISRMSYAYREVQDLIIAMFERMLWYGADGVHMLYNRGVPNLLYEDPVVEAFMQETGRDPRSLEEEDGEWLQFRAEYFTGFMRRVRQAMTQYGKDNSRAETPSVSAHVLLDERTNLFYALDVETWAREGLVDDVIVYPRIMKEPGTLNNAFDREIDIEYYADITSGTDTNVYVDLLPRQMTPGQFRDRANSIYERGAYGICLWDTHGRVQYPRQWSMMRRLGHKQELRGWDDGEGTYFRNLPFKVDKYGNWCT